MPRRALRKISPSLDLSSYLKTWEDLPKPWDGAALFGRTAPLEVEVGSGKGLFIASAAAARPEHNFFGVEVATKYARFCASRLARAGLVNGVMLHGDALRLFNELLPGDSVAAVHVYFPDPWWKKRHRKRRVLNEAFVKDAERVLEPSGRLHIWTDVKEYFDETLLLIAERTALSSPLSVEERPAEHDLDFHTHFERRTRLGGLPVYRSVFHKQMRRMNDGDML